MLDGEGAPNSSSSLWVPAGSLPTWLFLHVVIGYASFPLLLRRSLKGRRWKDLHDEYSVLHIDSLLRINVSAIYCESNNGLHEPLHYAAFHLLYRIE